MQNLTSYDYIKLSIADAMGIKINTWDESLEFINSQSIGELKANPLMDTQPEYYSAVTALEEATNTGKTAFMCSLDSPASLIGFAGILTNDPKCLYLGNMIREHDDTTSPRIHAYRYIEEHLGLRGIEYDPLKEAIMQSLYGGNKRAGEVFPSLDIFYEVAERELPGSWLLREAAISLHKKGQIYYEMFTPDGVKVVVNDKIKVERRIVSTASGKEKRVTMEMEVDGNKERAVSLAANIIHMFDAYVVRRVYKRMWQEGMQMRAIHDCFYTHPSHMQRLREILMEELIALYKLNWLNEIFKQLGGKYCHAPRISNIDLTEYLQNMEYHIC